MSLPWLTVVVFLSNLMVIGLLYATQELDASLPPANSIIPGTHQRFLHLQNFHTTLWGDVVGVPLMLTGFFWLVIHNAITMRNWVIVVLLSVFSAIYFAKKCLKPEHKPDIGFPASGKMSWTELVHLPYLGFCVASSMVSLVKIVYGEMEFAPDCLWFVGLALYALSFALDIKSGNFDPLKKV